MIEKVLTGKAAMLAHPVGKKKIDWTEELYLQPKLDGVRCLFTKQGAFSRSGKQFKNVQHIEKDLKQLFKDYPDAILDGELYNHDFKNNFEQIISLVRQGKQTEGQEAIQYHCYDLVDQTGALYSTRTDVITVFKGHYNLEFVHTVPSYRVKNMGLAVINNNKNLNLGYEGSILRRNHAYESKRSYNLQKFKKFEDTEATVIGYVAGRGKRTGGIGKFLCVDVDGNEFGCPVMAKMDVLVEMWNNREDYMGKTITFAYFGRTKYNSYRHPLFKCIRDYES